MNDLSPAAQAVLYAVVDGALPPFHVIARPMAAAALRAAADQVERKWRYFAHEACQEVRAIAAELEANR